MMRRHDKQMPVGCDTNQRHAHERPVRKVERFGVAGTQQGFNRHFAIVFSKVRNVHEPEGHREPRCDSQTERLT